MKKDCYHLNWYPPDWKFKKRDNMNTAYSVHTDNAQTSMSSKSRDKGKLLDKLAIGELPRAPRIIGDQHEYILEMIKRDPKQHSVMANMAGINHISSIELEDQNWIVHSGATNHITSSLSISK